MLSDEVNWLGFLKGAEWKEIKAFWKKEITKYFTMFEVAVDAYNKKYHNHPAVELYDKLNKFFYEKWNTMFNPEDDKNPKNPGNRAASTSSGHPDNNTRKDLKKSVESALEYFGGIDGEDEKVANKCNCSLMEFDIEKCMNGVETEEHKVGIL